MRRAICWAADRWYRPGWPFEPFPAGVILLNPLRAQGPQEWTEGPVLGSVPPGPWVLCAKGLGLGPGPVGRAVCPVRRGRGPPPAREERNDRHVASTPTPPWVGGSNLPSCQILHAPHKPRGPGRRAVLVSRSQRMARGGAVLGRSEVDSSAGLPGPLQDGPALNWAQTRCPPTDRRGHPASGPWVTWGSPGP